MKTELNRKERAEHLFHVITSKRFLSKQGFSEVPFFIYPFPALEGMSMDLDRANLVTQIQNAGVKVLDISLYDLALEVLSDRGILEQVIEIEAESDKDEIMELLQGVLDPKEHFAPKIEGLISTHDHDVVFLSGIGEIYPFLRANLILENLQSTIKDKPLVVFFPGKYTASVGGMTALHLFGAVPPQRYYRAFDIMNYEV
ncbi:uncharacterized protein DUF1788 [Pacificibacter maritimus]|uniref:Uncharacterized protein DUF1788 n=1 Tax=Pacificibacter maritimus TaxID=762213 RepID=A0A3N4UQU0_9RHOB|nr:DUF1788 domain-containing protein [Pacificibacter maritimus]RPE67327.1 uncharacterized protein DUF1788 [Pacificibacter maritimus]